MKFIYKQLSCIATVVVALLVVVVVAADAVSLSASAAKTRITKNNLAFHKQQTFSARSPRYNSDGTVDVSHFLERIIIDTKANTNSKRFQNIKIANNINSEAPSPLCPLHPTPIPLDSSNLPAAIQAALASMEQQVSALFNASVAANPLNAGSGLSLGIIYDQELIYYSGLGCVSPQGACVRPTPDTMYRIGSVSKTFVVLSLMQLIERGVISSLDEPLDTYLSAHGVQIVNPWDSSDAGRITWRQVCSQMSGLQRETPCGLTLFCNQTSAEVYAALNGTRLIAPPYTQPSYSNLGFALMGHLLQDAINGGQLAPDGDEVEPAVYYEWVKDQILAPLGMSNTGFEITPEVQAKMSPGIVNGQAVPPYNLGWNGPAGQMYSSVADFAKLISALLIDAKNDNKPSLLQKTTIDQLMQPLFLNNDGTTLWGTPWEMIFQNNYVIKTKGGNIPGYSALFSFVPELKLGAAVLFNGGQNEAEYASVIYNALIPAFVNVFSSYVAPTPPPLPADISDYLGVYSPTASPSALAPLRIDPSTGALLFGNGAQLVWVPDADASTSGLGNNNNIARDVFQLQYTQLALEYTACESAETTALDDEYVYFVRDPSSGNKVVYMVIPGALLAFQKVQ